MGAELPDPMEQSTEDGEMSADDLLAQMAGDEIDRLLAEAETDVAELPTPSAEAVDEQAVIASARSAAEEEAKETLIAPPADSSMKAELDALFNALEQPAAAPVLSGAESASNSAGIETPPLSGAPTSLERELLSGQTGSVERSVLAAEIMDAAGQMLATEAPAASEDRIEAPAGEDGRIPLYFQPLLWINAPLEGVSDTVRIRIGHVAILTLINAILILLWVLLR